MPDLTHEQILKMEAGPELRRLVAELLGWQIGARGGKLNISPDGDKWATCKDVWEGIPDYPNDIEGAWEVVEKIKSIPAGIDILVRANCVAIDLHVFDPADGLVKDIEAGDAPTAPLAICRAALAASIKLTTSHA